MAAVTNNNLFLLPDYAIPKFFGLFHHHLVQLIKQAVVSGGGGVEEPFCRRLQLLLLLMPVKGSRSIDGDCVCIILVKCLFEETEEAAGQENIVCDRSRNSHGIARCSEPFSRDYRFSIKFFGRSCGELPLNRTFLISPLENIQ